MILTRTTLLVTALFIAAGCNKKGADSTAPEAPSDLTVVTTAAQKLSDVNCISMDNKVQCDPVDGSRSDPPLDNKTAELVYEQKGISKQMSVMEDYITAIQQDLGSSAVNETDKKNLRELYSAAVACDLDLQKNLAKNQIDQNNEAGFNHVFGFQCGGTYGGAGAQKSFSQYIDTTDHKTDLDEIYASTGDLDLTGDLRFTKTDSQVRWTSSQSLDGAKRDLKTVVLSDGEFAMQTSDSAKIDMNCLRLRAFGTAKTLSDQPIRSRQMRCLSETIQAPLPGATKSQSMSWSMEFTAVSDGDDREISLNTPADDLQVEIFGFRPKYTVALKMVKGVLNFRVIEGASFKEMMTVQTANSVPNISFGLFDTAGNSVKVKCGEEVPDTYKNVKM